MTTRLITIGIGGASCSGKTTLAKHLARLLPGTVVHQDDFAPPAERVPVHALHGVADWDDPDTAVEWGRMRAFMARLRSRGAAEYTSRDALNAAVNAKVDVPLSRGTEARWAERFEKIRSKKEQEERLVFVLVDGFVLFYDREVTDALDVRVLLRRPKEVLQQRREGRVYALQNEENERDFWVDPPDYFPNIVWPAYVKAHAGLFQDGNVEGSPRGDLEGGSVHVLDESDIGALVDEVCGLVLRAVDDGVGVRL